MSFDMNSFRLDGKVALITGGASGTGFGIARALAAAGAKIVFNCRDPKRLDSARGEFAALWSPILPFDP